ncbi:MAG: hypothetical protein H6818_01025 [Phycisphaerales bacterium]|nr:hypothetical protein [Phycisphaerales bacterium]MCB9864753.1 hypothetical protein [Phycisphaerales bacterium]
MFLPLTIQFHIIVGLLASRCDGSVLGASGPDRDGNAIVILADFAFAVDHFDSDPADYDGPAGSDILLDSATWPLLPGSDAWGIDDSLPAGDAACRWLQSRAPPLRYEA